MSMLSRRGFIKSMAAISASSLISANLMASSRANRHAPYVMPDESEPHRRTWMAFGASRGIWGSKLLPAVRENLVDIALTIANYEPVSMLVRESELSLANKLMGNDVELLPCPLDDLWMRDTGPVFVKTPDSQKGAIDFNFNGWGGKQTHRRDSAVAAFVAEQAQVPVITTDLVLEGGGIEVDGHGTAIITESCVLNANRNPGLSKTECELELKRLLGLEKIIWLPGIKGKDITDGHTDFYARFASPGVVLAAYDSDPYSFDHAVTKRHLEILRDATDAMGNRLKVAVLEAPTRIRDRFAHDDFAAGYINFYLCNGAVIAPEFGDPQADGACREKLADAFPDRDIIQLNIDALAAGGGGIHCTTQQEPKF
ncbi:agmatine deiminase family protein [Lacimicrobium sp. SS2-24]|uniref:agmatine deiminase family protein n=1 Tax=Lacimicrobium sp. SS2-24 TaxID=2005569 RepID=UPI001FEEC3B5|nr:agmatine deiminase family protein [Lacimicrobium sp. SS2-24]